MGQPAYELVLSVVGIVAITAGYVFLGQDGVPQPNSLVGYGLGISGFLMMLSTETLYSLRKRARGVHFGPMAIWLQVHVFTGLVGPYLVLLHSGWRFHGLAGVLTLLTGVVVVSGLIGRYIYTAVPRSVDGAALAMYQLEERMVDIDRDLQAHGIAHLGSAMLAATKAPKRGWFTVLGRPLIRLRQRRHLRQEIEKLGEVERAKATEFEGLLTERLRLQREIAMLDATRKLLALWHLFHIPLSASLFVVAFMHIGGALYYAALSN